MTEEEVVNVRGKISDGDVENADHHPEPKVPYCNGVSHVKEKEKEKEKEEKEVDAVVVDDGGGTVDADCSSDFVGGSEVVAVDGDSGVSDLNVVVDNDNSGAAATDGLKLQSNHEHKVVHDGQALDESSKVTVSVSISVSEAAETECECESQQINGTAKVFTDASAVYSGVVEEILETEVDNSTISVDADIDGENVQREVVSVSAEESEDGQNSSGEKAEIDCVENVQSVSVADLNVQECENIVGADADESIYAEGCANEQNCSGEDKARNGCVGNFQSTSVPDLNQNQKCENIVPGADADVSGDEKAVLTVVQGVADVNQRHESKKLVDADDQNGSLDKELSKGAEENEISVNVDVDRVSAADVNGEVGADDQNGLVDRELSDHVEENDIPVPVESVSAEDLHKIHESIVGIDDVQNSLADTEQSECASKENETSATDVEKCQEFNVVVSGADEDAQNSSGEKAQIESVSASPECNSGGGDEKDVENVVDGRRETAPDTDVQDGLAEIEVSKCAEENEIPIKGELVPEVENLPASTSSSTDTPGYGNVKTDTNVNVVESKVDPSVDMPDMNDNEVEGDNHGDGDLRPAPEGSTADVLDGQDMGAEVEKRPFYFLIKLPRYDDDENLKDQIKDALQQVEEKTKSRDAIRAEIQIRKASCKECSLEVREAVSAERAARDLLKSKRQEMDSVQTTMNRLNNAISVEDIGGRIKNMEHKIEHETLPLKEEKQLLRQIKQLKQNREELSSNMGKQDQLQQSVDHKDSIEEQFKHLQLLKKEMELLRQNVLKTEAVTKAARKKYDDESSKLSELLARFKASDDIRQEAYVKLQTLKKQLYEKNQYFWDYKNAANKGHELAAEGKKEELQRFCVNQVERIMEQWNKNDEFRREYLRCNTRSTLRRLRTLDGRSLGPDEAPPVIPNAVAEKASKNNSLLSQSTMEQAKESILTETVNIKEEPVSTVVVQTSQTTKAKKPAKPAPSEKKPLVVFSSWADEAEAEDLKEEPVRKREEDERILKAENARKEEEAAKLKEKRRLEEIEKAKEAMERKKRNADKAQQRAALKAQREAEQKEKERERRLRKKERRKAAATPDAAAHNTEHESAPSSETLTRSTEECDQSEKPVEVTKRQQKPSQFTRQTKAKSIPPPLRNRGRRRIQPWMWVLIASLVVVALFFTGNNSFLRSGLRGFGF